MKKLLFVIFVWVVATACSSPTAPTLEPSEKASQSTYVVATD